MIPDNTKPSWVESAMSDLISELGVWASATFDEGVTDEERIKAFLAHQEQQDVFAEGVRFPIRGFGGGDHSDKFMSKLHDLLLQIYRNGIVAGAQRQIDKENSNGAN